MMKHMSAMHVVKELGPEIYAPTTLSQALIEPKYRDGIVVAYVSPSHLARIKALTRVLRVAKAVRSLSQPSTMHLITSKRLATRTRRAARTAPSTGLMARTSTSMSGCTRTRATWRPSPTT